MACRKHMPIIPHGSLSEQLEKEKQGAGNQLNTEEV